MEMKDIKRLEFCYIFASLIICLLVVFLNVDNVIILTLAFLFVCFAVPLSIFRSVDMMVNPEQR